MSSAGTQFRALFVRELRTVVRTRVYLLVALGVWALVVALVATGGGGQSGYLPAVVDLLLPLELLVPAIAIAVGYRSVVADLERGELAPGCTWPRSTPAALSRSLRCWSAGWSLPAS